MYISIGIPFYNAEDYLELAIKSVFAQSHKEWELILIDDGSTDNSLKIAKSINDTRVRVISDGKNKKLASRLNEIVKLAKYDLVARMDADDLMAPNRLEKQLNILNKNSSLDLVSTGLISISNNLKPLGARWHYSNSITFDEILKRKGCGVVHAAILGKKSWFARNPYNESLELAQDYELWVNASAKNDFNIYLIQEPLYYYREEGSVTAKKVLKSYINEKKIFKKYLKNKWYMPVLKINLKIVVVSILEKINKFHFLVRKRNTNNFEQSLVKDYNKNLNEIQCVKLKKF